MHTYNFIFHNFLQSPYNMPKCSIPLFHKLLFVLLLPFVVNFSSRMAVSATPETRSHCIEYIKRETKRTEKIQCNLWKSLSTCAVYVPYTWTAHLCPDLPLRHVLLQEFYRNLPPINLVSRDEIDIYVRGSM